LLPAPLRGGGWTGANVASKIHLNVLVRMGGVVTRRTAVFPQLAQVKYDCAKCSYKLGPYIQTSDTEVRAHNPHPCMHRH
jgi:DNA replication licensing factor MCM2